MDTQTAVNFEALRVHGGVPLPYGNRRIEYVRARRRIPTRNTQSPHC